MNCCFKRILIKQKCVQAAFTDLDISDDDKIPRNNLIFNYTKNMQTFICVCCGCEKN